MRTVFSHSDTTSSGCTFMRSYRVATDRCEHRLLKTLSGPCRTQGTRLVWCVQGDAERTSVYVVQHRHRWDCCWDVSLTSAGRLCKHPTPLSSELAGWSLADLCLGWPNPSGSYTAPPNHRWSPKRLSGQSCSSELFLLCHTLNSLPWTSL